MRVEIIGEGRGEVAAEPLQETSPSRGPELLVVEDDPEIGALIAGIAERAGYETAVATNVGQFQECLRVRRRTVVLDLNLPDGDGVEIIRMLAKEGSVEGLILVSGAGERLILAARRLAEEQGIRVIGALSKPFRASALRKLLGESDAKPRIKSLEPAAGLTEAEIRRAVVGGDLEVYYQPKIHLVTQGISGVEALVRLKHPTLGIMPPATFVHLAERYGLIDPLTDFVCAQAFADVSRWREDGFDLSVSVNVSLRSLHRLDLPDQLEAGARRHRIPHERFTVEVTESSVAEEPVRALDILTRIRLKGFGLSIDDFGTGYSTLRQLERIPFGELKLDREFVRGATRNAGARAIMASSIDLAHRLEMRVVAEGVETPEDLALITRMHCDEAQGFLFSKPMPRSEVLPWLKAWTGVED